MLPSTMVGKDRNSSSVLRLLFEQAGPIVILSESVCQMVRALTTGLSTSMVAHSTGLRHTGGRGSFMKPHASVMVSEDCSHGGDGGGGGWADRGAGGGAYSDGRDSGGHGIGKSGEIGRASEAMKKYFG